MPIPDARLRSIRTLRIIDSLQLNETPAWRESSGEMTETLPPIARLERALELFRRECLPRQAGERPLSAWLGHYLMMDFGVRRVALRNFADGSPVPSTAFVIIAQTGADCPPEESMLLRNVASTVPAVLDGCGNAILPELFYVSPDEVVRWSAHDLLAR
jgi:hypothetical protein